MKKISCGVLIYKKVENDLYVLLGHATNQKWWDIFKGGKDENESTYVCAVRELYEETGLAFPAHKYNKLHYFPNYRPNKELYVYPIEVNDINVKSLKALPNIDDSIEFEFDEYQWVKYEDIPNYVGTSLQKVITYICEKLNY